MNDYPDNSHSSREQNQNSNYEQKLEKVVNGDIKTRKKSKARKLTNVFADIFIPENKSEFEYFIFEDVIEPTIKKVISDIVSIVLYKETGHVGGSRGGRSRIQYQNYYRDDRRYMEDRREYGRPRSVINFDYDDIIFETRGDAELVLNSLEDAIAQYGIASVADLYDLSGVTCRGYTANKYGWTDIRSAKVIRTSDGYILQLPRAIEIK